VVVSPAATGQAGECCALLRERGAGPGAGASHDERHTEQSPGASPAASSIRGPGSTSYNVAHISNPRDDKPKKVGGKPSTPVARSVSPGALRRTVIELGGDDA